MKILLVTRGSQGDVLPYLAVASCLVRRGHEVTVNLPCIFEEEAKSYGLTYVLQHFDDINGMIGQAAEKRQKFRPFLKWMRAVIDNQFEQLVPLLEKHDILVSTNSEFAVASVAEYCRKPLVRTAYAPLLPGKKIPPATLPFPKPNPVITPGLLWKLMNRITNFMVRGTINRKRVEYGMPPIRNFGFHAGEHSYNYLMFSQYLGNTDPDWIFKWKIGGYCFNDSFAYDKETYDEMRAFVCSAATPVLFFTLGSCSTKDGNRFCRMLINICRRCDYRLIVGSGWAKTGMELEKDDHLFLMKHPVPHYLIFPECDGIIHHGGSGTTHSAARSGRPQMVTPLIIDQPYWGYRVSQLEIGPAPVKIAKVTEKELEQKVCDLVTNKVYRENAKSLGDLIRSEQGVVTLCNYIEEIGKSK